MKFFTDKTMRWYGPKDGLTLQDILQAGCTGVVHALHHIPIGEVWTVDEITQRKHHIEKHGLKWKVVESLPVSEDIKTRTGNYKEHIENYKNSLRNLSDCGIEVVTYNFMPVLDWTRTDVNHILRNGCSALLFNKIDLGVFDIHLLKRRDASSSYSEEENQLINNKYHLMSSEERKRLQKTILLGFPGSDEALEPAYVLEGIEAYETIDRSRLKEHLSHFLQEVVPVAEAAEIKLAIHPDDPPMSVLGLPRIVSTEEDLQFIIDSCPSPYNGLCFCTGSLGANPDIEVSSLLRKFRKNIHFFHLRNVYRENDEVFYESDHLDGENDMVAVIEEVIETMKEQNQSIPMRPDHGHQFLFDTEREYYPGYSYVGRLKGLSELRGLELALSQS